MSHIVELNRHQNALSHHGAGESINNENLEAEMWVKNATLVVPGSRDDSRGISVNSDEEYTVNLNQVPSQVQKSHEKKRGSKYGMDLSMSILT